jgi:hypothetical protein
MNCVLDAALQENPTPHKHSKPRTPESTQNNWMGSELQLEVKRVYGVLADEIVKRRLNALKISLTVN